MHGTAPFSRTLPTFRSSIVPGNVPTMRCCVYKERAILGERVKLAIGGDAENPNVIEVIDIACDECPVGGYDVTDACRGCLAHRCEDVCRRGAISFDQQQKAHIDKSKCVECGACAKVCPYSAIIELQAPVRERLQGQGYLHERDTRRQRSTTESASPAAPAYISVPSEPYPTNHSF